jgi:hypothetical protein
MFESCRAHHEKAPHTRGFRPSVGKSVLAERRAGQSAFDCPRGVEHFGILERFLFGQNRCGDTSGSQHRCPMRRVLNGDESYLLVEGV